MPTTAVRIDGTSASRITAALRSAPAGAGRNVTGMSRQVITTPDAPSSPLFSQGVRVGSVIHVSGMTGTDVSTKQLAGPSIGEQTRQSLRNCEAVLRAGGGTLDDVVQVTVLLADPADFAGMNAAYAEIFSAAPPARAVAKLGVEIAGVLVSIMMTAHLDG